VIAKEVIGHPDDSGCTDIDVNIRMIVVTPANAKGPVPLLIMFGPAAFPSPNQPSEEEFARINRAMKELLLEKDPSLKQVFEQHPAFQLSSRTPFQLPPRNEDGDPPNTWELVADGWGFALLDPTTVQADNGAGLTRGIIGLTNHGQPRKPEDWGALRAWAWGASKALDLFLTEPRIDAKRVAVEGLSRYGKAALVTMAFDQRFSLGFIGSSGAGGAKPLRRDFGERLENLTASGEYHWFAPAFLRYGGPKTVNDLPFDAHSVIALAAPRPLFIGAGNLEQDGWVDPKGSAIAAQEALPVYRVLGAPEDCVVFRQHEGGHTNGPNWPAFLDFAEKVWSGRLQCSARQK